MDDTKMKNCEAPATGNGECRRLDAEWEQKLEEIHRKHFERLQRFRRWEQILTAMVWLGAGLVLAMIFFSAWRRISPS